MSDSTTIILGVIAIILAAIAIIVGVVGLWLMLMAAMARYDLEQQYGKERVEEEIPKTSYQPLPVKFANWRRKVWNWGCDVKTTSVDCCLHFFTWLWTMRPGAPPQQFTVPF
ncbi:unnamed protein product [Clonostachys chloroleuca]|uniref:Uncharacterized protein n=1 Tax=Clonostachys chloroleuca TaxID=1926264 RepID=A0AA35MCT4_9HYPO|nr:unnamed protein product [Clonostachys chloroleuca]